MTGYSVLIEARAPEGAEPLADPEAHADRFATEVERWHGAVTVGPDRWDARISVNASDASAAVAGARMFIRGAAMAAGLPAWPDVRVEAVREDVLDEGLPEPAFD